MFTLPNPANDPIAQAVQFGVAMSLIPKDSTTEAFKGNAVSTQTLARVKEYKSILKEVKADWRIEGPELLKQCGDNPDHADYKAAFQDYRDEVQGWKDCIKAAQGKLKS
jgi:hypothetical protein